MGEDDYLNDREGKERGNRGRVSPNAEVKPGRDGETGREQPRCAEPRDHTRRLGGAVPTACYRRRLDGGVGEQRCVRERDVSCPARARTLGSGAQQTNDGGESGGPSGPTVTNSTSMRSARWKAAQRLPALHGQLLSTGLTQITSICGVIVLTAEVKLMPGLPLLMRTIGLLYSGSVQIS